MTYSAHLFGCQTTIAYYFDLHTRHLSVIQLAPKADVFSLALKGKGRSLLRRKVKINKQNLAETLLPHKIAYSFNQIIFCECGAGRLARLGQLVHDLRLAVGADMAIAGEGGERAFMPKVL